MRRLWGVVGQPEVIQKNGLLGNVQRSIREMFPVNASRGAKKESLRNKDS
jgi:hypothetical protein